MFNVAEFADDTDFERFALDRLGVDRVRFEEPSTRFDVRGRGTGVLVQVGLATTVDGTERYDELRRALRPIAFGIAYKVLDLLVEHTLRACGGTAARMTFKEKQSAIRSTPAVLPPRIDRHVWDRFALIYISLAEARHALTHRRAQPTTDGGLEIYDDLRQPEDAIAADEMTAFIASVRSITEVVIGGSSDDRRAAIIAWYLNQLRSRHRLPDLPATDPTTNVRQLIMDITATEAGLLTFDVARARQIIDGQPPSYWDLELHGPTKTFVGRWEDLHDDAAESISFEPGAPPDWLHDAPFVG